MSMRPAGVMCGADGPLVVYFAGGQAVKCIGVYKVGWKPHYRFCRYWH